MKDMNWVISGTFAHRGLHNEGIPENTIEAFQNAFQNNFDIELDIQMTKDDKIVVFHDKNLKRLCDVDFILEDMDYDEIKEYTILNSKQTIPLLEEVLYLIPSKTHLLIEFKPTKRHKKIVHDFLLLMEKFNHTYAIHSFDPRIVIDFKKVRPDIIRGFITENFSFKEYGIKGKISGKLLVLRNMKPDFINYGIKDLPYKKLDRLKKKGMVVLSYTARTQEQLDFVRNRYDNAVFEHFIPKK